MRWRCVASAISSSRYLRSNSLSSGVMVTSMTRGSRPSGPVSTDISCSDSVSPVSSARRISGLQRVGLEHQRKKGFAARLVDADGQQVLRGDVGVDHAQVGIEHHDAGGQRADQVGGLEMRDRRRQEAFNRHARLRPAWPRRGAARRRPQCGVGRGGAGRGGGRRCGEFSVGTLHVERAAGVADRLARSDP